MDFDKFLKVNDLRQIELANFLGTSKSYVSQLIKKQVGISPERLNILLNNDRGWDVTMLQKDDKDRLHYENGRTKFTAESAAYPAPDMVDILERIQAKMQEMEKAIVLKDDQINRLLSILEKMSK